MFNGGTGLVILSLPCDSLPDSLTATSWGNHGVRVSSKQHFQCPTAESLDRVIQGARAPSDLQNKKF